VAASQANTSGDEAVVKRVFKERAGESGVAPASQLVDCILMLVARTGSDGLPRSSRRSSAGPAIPAVIRDN
jgi:hypothetical protein